MKALVSQDLRTAFARLKGGRNWGKGNLRGGCSCAATACGTVGSLSWATSEAVDYLYKALPQWARESINHPVHWNFVARYNDDPRTEFRHISALYGKAIKLALIDESAAAGLTGKANLLRVALVLREARNPTFDMQAFVHGCGTPACALGHYAARTDLQDAFVIRSLTAGDRPYVYGSAQGYHPIFDVAKAHFDLTVDETFALFDQDGCGEAKTAIEAADYIEAFAHAKWPAQKGGAQ